MVTCISIKISFAVLFKHPYSKWSDPLGFFWIMSGRGGKIDFCIFAGKSESFSTKLRTVQAWYRDTMSGLSHTTVSFWDFHSRDHHFSILQVVMILRHGAVWVREVLLQDQMDSWVTHLSPGVEMGTQDESCSLIYYVSINRCRWISNGVSLNSQWLCRWLFRTLIRGYSERLSMIWDNMIW